MMINEIQLAKEFSQFVTPTQFGKQLNRLIEIFYCLERFSYSGIAKISLDLDFCNYYIADEQILGPYCDADRWLLQESEKLDSLDFLGIMFIGHTHRIPIAVPIVLNKKDLWREALTYTLFSLLYQFDWRAFLRAWHDRDLASRLWDSCLQKDFIQKRLNVYSLERANTPKFFSRASKGNSYFIEEIPPFSTTKLPLISLCDRVSFLETAA